MGIYFYSACLSRGNWILLGVFLALLRVVRLILSLFEFEVVLDSNYVLLVISFSTYIYIFFFVTLCFGLISLLIYI